MGRALVIIIPVVLTIYTFIDAILSDAGEVRGPRKGLWLAAIVLLPVLGPVAWLLLGRPRELPAQQPKPAARPVAPEDDPEFLRQLREIDAEHERMLKMWERDLRRREEDLKRGDEAGDGNGTDRP